MDSTLKAFFKDINTKISEHIIKKKQECYNGSNGDSEKYVVCMQKFLKKVDNADIRLAYGTRFVFHQTREYLEKNKKTEIDPEYQKNLEKTMQRLKEEYFKNI